MTTNINNLVNTLSTSVNTLKSNIQNYTKSFNALGVEINTLNEYNPNIHKLILKLKELLSLTLDI